MTPAHPLRARIIGSSNQRRIPGPSITTCYVSTRAACQAADAGTSERLIAALKPSLPTCFQVEIDLRAVLAATLLTMLGATTAASAVDSAGIKLMSQCKAASGGGALDRPRAFHEHGTFTRDGVSGTYDEYGDLVGMRTHGTHVFADHSDGGGFDGHVVWRQKADGSVSGTSDAAALRDARTDAYLTVGGYFYPDRFPADVRSLGRRSADGRAFDVVEVTPEGGSPVDLWLDERSHRLTRITTGAERGAYAEVFDYRQIEGTWIGFASRQVEAGHKVELRLTSYAYEPLDESHFMAPAVSR